MVNAITLTAIIAYHIEELFVELKISYKCTSQLNGNLIVAFMGVTQLMSTQLFYMWSSQKNYILLDNIYSFDSLCLLFTPLLFLKRESDARFLI